MGELRRFLGDEFSVEGYWWLPERSANKVAGTLSHDPHRHTALETIGTLQEDADPSIPVNSAVPAILGVTRYGERCTVLSPCSMGTSLNIHSGLGIETEKYLVPRAIFGGHFPRERDQTFIGCKVRLEGLAEWVGKTSLSVSLPKGSASSKTLVILQHNPIDDLRCDLPGQNTQIWITFVLTWSLPFFEGVKWKWETFLQILPKRKQPMAWIAERVWDVQAVITLLSGSMRDLLQFSLLRQERVTFRMKTRYRRREFDFVCTPSLPDSERPILIPQILIPLELLGIEGFAGVLSCWISKKAESSPLLGLYLHTAHGQNMPLETKLLFYTQVLESFHRKTMGGQYLSEEDYQAIYNLLVKAIPGGSSVPNELRERLKSSLRYGNEYSQRTRFKRILLGLSHETRQLLLRDLSLERFVGEVVDTRNYYTHYSAASSRVLAGELLLDRVRRLRQLVALVFLLELGINEKLLVSRLASLPGLVI
jgi:hypothetical protein